MAAGNTVEARVGIDTYSNSNLSDDSDVEGKLLKRGFELGAEYRKDLGTGFELGGGIFYKYSKLNMEDDYHLLSNYSEKTEGMRSVPMYATARYNFMTPMKDVKPYVKTNLGYSFNSAKYTYSNSVNNEEIKLKSGLYYGLGAGVQYKSYSADLTYNVLRTKATGTENGVEYYSDNIDNKFLTLSFGYNFGF